MAGATRRLRAEVHVLAWIGAFIFIGAWVRILRWVWRRLRGHEPGLVAAHLVSLLSAIALYGLAEATGPFSDRAGLRETSITYVVCQLAWLAVDSSKRR